MKSVNKKKMRVIRPFIIHISCLEKIQTCFYTLLLSIFQDFFFLLQKSFSSSIGIRLTNPDAASLIKFVNFCMRGYRSYLFTKEEGRWRQMHKEKHLISSLSYLPECQGSLRMLSFHSPPSSSTFKDDEDEPQ